MGRLQIRRFEDTEGKPRTAVEIEATSIGHDLTRGVAKFSRTRWPAATTAADAEVPADGQGAGERPGRGGGAPDGDGVIDESAVAEFARELSESLGPDAAANSAVGATTDAEAGASA